MLSILSSTLQALIFLFIAAFVSGFLFSDFTKKSQFTAQNKSNTATSNK